MLEDLCSVPKTHTFKKKGEEKKKLGITKQVHSSIAQEVEKDGSLGLAGQPA